MSSLKDTVEKLRNLEAEKLSLTLEIEDLKKMADARAAVLENEIAALREEAKSLRKLMGEERPQQPSSNEYLREITSVASREFAEKTVDALNKSGSQVFAVSPFGQYFDDWLVDLRKILSDFESNSTVRVDEQFVKDRSQIFLDVEGALTKKRLEESNLSEDAKALADNNQLLEETDKEYAEKRKELNLRKDAEVESITKKIHKLEEESQEAKKIKIFNYKSKGEYNNARKKAEEKLTQTKDELESTKSELEAAQQSFSAEQKILEDIYEKKKHEITERNEILHKELKKLETDTSIDARQAACNALANAVNSLIQRYSVVT